MGPGRLPGLGGDQSKVVGLRGTRTTRTTRRQETGWETNSRRHLKRFFVILLRQAFRWTMERSRFPKLKEKRS